jgi:Caspase domain
MANQACISIGINQYQFLPPLGYGMADAVAMEQFFVDAAGWSPSQCLLLTDTSPKTGNKSTYPDRANINRWIKQWSWDRLHAGDLLWFFFSGCGVSFEGDDYLVPIDGSPADIASTCISIRQLYQQFRDIGVNALVFLDANHSQHLSLGDGIGEVTARLAQEYQIPTFLSCQSHEFSHEDAGLGHGLFTTALLEALNYHPDLNLETIDTYLTTRLAELSEHHWKPLQTPLAIVPTSISVYRPVFSSTTQSSIATTIPEIVYTPPTSSKFGQEDSYAAYKPPSQSAAIFNPAPIGTGAIVKRSRPAPRRKNLPNWARVSFLLSLIIAAGGGIYVFKSQSPAKKEQPNVQPVVNSLVSSANTTTLLSSTEQLSGLAQARLFIKPGDATSRYMAILAARKIPATTPVAATEVKQSIDQWSQEIYLIASGYASKKHWQLAIDTAIMVPQDVSNHAEVKDAIAEWRQKL